MRKSSPNKIRQRFPSYRSAAEIKAEAKANARAAHARAERREWEHRRETSKVLQWGLPLLMRHAQDQAVLIERRSERIFKRPEIVAGWVIHQYSVWGRDQWENEERTLQNVVFTETGHYGIAGGGPSVTYPIILDMNAPHMTDIASLPGLHSIHIPRGEQLRSIIEAIINEG